MLNQLKSEFLKLKYSKLFIAVPILLLAVSACPQGEHSCSFRRETRRQMLPYRA